MLLIAGLGNPSSEYNHTRHNLGFMAVDYFIEDQLKLPLQFQNNCQAGILKTSVAGKSVLFAKPQTYMNLSGLSIKALTDYYKIPVKNILIIQDDLELGLLRFKYQNTHGHSGHNGIRNIHQELGTTDYARLKLGIGRPKNPNTSVSHFVTEKFLPEELLSLESFLKSINNSLMHFITEGFTKTVEHFNNKRVQL
ncbi:MAG: aminoacyl-tRNA hydrolase [Bdellovibrionaceae bacterium]|nr:aminoacyl-tRNA hydrolase [Pseudobdellovibrionaceae bacterium]